VFALMALLKEKTKGGELTGSQYHVAQEWLSFSE
jgi:hypothetical protein